MSFSVIIPSSNIDNLERCIQAARLESGSRIIAIGDDLEICYSSTSVYPGIQPFVFSRNVNLGIKIAGGDVILMNDDAVLIEGSLTDLMTQAVRIGGIVSASIRGAVNNPAQLEKRVTRDGHIREITTGYLAFVCVAIPRHVINRIGMLDERFVTYGGEDVDYCHRARVEDIPLSIYDWCVVDHGNLLPSTFRHNGVPSIEPGLRILREKWTRIQNTPLPL
jgi:hypothetical protein